MTGDDFVLLFEGRLQSRDGLEGNSVMVFPESSVLPLNIVQSCPELCAKDAGEARMIRRNKTCFIFIISQSFINASAPVGQTLTHFAATCSGISSNS